MSSRVVSVPLTCTVGDLTRNLKWLISFSSWNKRIIKFVTIWMNMYMYISAAVWCFISVSNKFNLPLMIYTCSTFLKKIFILSIIYIKYQFQINIISYQETPSACTFTFCGLFLLHHYKKHSYFGQVCIIKGYSGFQVLRWKSTSSRPSLRKVRNAILQ